MKPVFLAALAASALLAAGCREAPPSSTTEGPSNSAPQPVGTPTGPTSTGAAGSPSDTGTAGATGTGPTGGSADATSGTGPERAADGAAPADGNTGARGSGGSAAAGTTMDSSSVAPPASGAGAQGQSPRATPSGNNISAGGVAPSVQPAPAAAQVDPSALALADQNFLTTAAAATLFELDAARGAGEHASRAEVKSYAAMLVKEHTAALDELRALAARKKVNLASEVAPARKPDLDQLLGLRGAEFDRRFLHNAIEAHKTDIDLYDKTAGTAQDADVRAYAKLQLPKLRQHLAAAQKLAGGTTAK